MKNRQLIKEIKKSIELGSKIEVEQLFFKNKNAISQEEMKFLIGVAECEEQNEILSILELEQDNRTRNLESQLNSLNTDNNKEAERQKPKSVASIIFDQEINSLRKENYNLVEKDSLVDVLLEDIPSFIFSTHITNKSVNYDTKVDNDITPNKLEASKQETINHTIQPVTGRKFFGDAGIIQNIVIPFINQTKKGFTTKMLEQLLCENASKICTALFDEKKDTDKLFQFIEKLYKNIDSKNDLQVNVYNDLYNMADVAIQQPKEADGRWITYDEAHKNCEYMHLFALIAENIPIDNVLGGQLDIQSEDIL